jgi:hypothetical protein
MRMRVFLAATLIALTAGSASAQGRGNAQGRGPANVDTAKPKSPQEIQAEQDAERAYKKSLGNIPDKGPADPWGNMRGDDAPKPVAKVAPAKKTKTGSTAN